MQYYHGEPFMTSDIWKYLTTQTQAYSGYTDVNKIMLNYDLSLFNEGVEDLKQDIKRMRSSARKKKKKKYRQFFLEA